MTNRKWRKRQKSKVAAVMAFQAIPPRQALPASAWGAEAAKVAARQEETR